MAVAAIQSENRPVKKVEAFFRLLYGEHMRGLSTPKRQEDEKSPIQLR